MEPSAIPAIFEQTSRLKNLKRLSRSWQRNGSDGAGSGTRKEARADYYSKIETIKQQLQKAYVIQNTAKMNAEQVKAKKADAKAVSRFMKKELSWNR